jgi:hypothetical protein
MANAPRPRGRPRHNIDEAKRHPLTIRTTKALKDALVAAANSSSRSLAGEIEFRLNQTFWHESGYADRLAGDPQWLLYQAVGQIRSAAFEFINQAEARGLMTEAEAASARRQWRDM